MATDREKALARYLVAKAQDKRWERAGHRPGHGAGTSADDIYRPTPPGEAHHVDQDLVGVLTCQDCGELVIMVESPPGTWTKRDPETRTPHALSCTG